VKIYTCRLLSPASFFVRETDIRCPFWSKKGRNQKIPREKFARVAYNTHLHSGCYQSLTISTLISKQLIVKVARKVHHFAHWANIFVQRTFVYSIFSATFFILCCKLISSIVCLFVLTMFHMFLFILNKSKGPVLAADMHQKSPYRVQYVSSKHAVLYLYLPYLTTVTCTFPTFNKDHWLFFCMSSDVLI